jgi:branched-chain amino acid transport system permease protein
MNAGTPPPGRRSGGVLAEPLRHASMAVLHVVLLVLTAIVRAFLWMFGPSLRPFARILAPPLRLVGRLLAPIARPAGRLCVLLGRTARRGLAAVGHVLDLALSPVVVFVGRALAPIGRVLARALRPIALAVVALVVGLVRLLRATTVRTVKFLANPHVRLFIACEFFGVVAAIVTGPQGNGSTPTKGFTDALGPPRGFWFYAFGAALFVVRLQWSIVGNRATVSARRAKVAVQRGFQAIWLRVLLEALLVGFGFADVTWIAPHDVWKGGLCVQIGVALLALELSLWLWHRVAPRVGRLAAYGALAGYGALAWSPHGFAYLNRVNVVLQNQAFGKFLMIGALVVAILDVLGFAFGIVRQRNVRRALRSRGIGAAVVLFAYGWLMWTNWSQWQASEPTTLAHWLATHHLLVHSHGAGLAVLTAATVVVLACAIWVIFDLVRGPRVPSDGQPVGRSVMRRASMVPFSRPALAIAALLIALEWPLHMDTSSQSNLVSQIMPFVLLALGLNVVIGFAGLLDLGYVAFYAIGAYFAAYFTGALPVQPPFVLDLFWVIPVAIVAAMLAGVLLGLPTLRLRGDYLAIVTLGFGEIIYVFANNLTFITGGAEGAPGIVPYFNFHLDTPFLKAGQAWGPISYVPTYYLILGVIIVSMAAFSLLERSRVGRSWAAIREDEVAADSLGVNALKYKVMAFAIGASTGGMAGVFLVGQSGSLFPSGFTLQFSITVVVCVVFGGMGSIPGVMLGAAIVEGLPAYLQQHNFAFYNSLDFQLYLGALLIVMMIFRPQGIIPARRRRREFQLAGGVGLPGFTSRGSSAAFSLGRPPVGPETE